MVIHHHRHIVHQPLKLLMGVAVEQWMAMTALTLITIVLGLIPYVIVRRTKYMVNSDSCAYKCVVTILSCFGGGVLLATVLLHLLPEVREDLSANKIIQETFDEHFPVAEMVMLCGFAIIYLVEEMAHFLMVDSYNGNVPHHGKHNHVRVRSLHKKNVSTAYSIPISGTNMPYGETSSIVKQTRSKSLGSGLNMRPDSMVSMEEDLSSMGSQVIEEIKASPAAMLRASLALIALSFHAIVEGAAIGVQVGIYFIFVSGRRV